MKNIFGILCTIIISVFSLNNLKPNICVNCKFFMKSFNIGNQYGKCSMFPVKKTDIDLVTGIKKDDMYQFCSIARSRDHLCGEDGKKYVEK